MSEGQDPGLGRQADEEALRLISALAREKITIEQVTERLGELNNEGVGLFTSAALAGHASQMLQRLAEVFGESASEAARRYAEYYQFVDIVAEWQADDDSDD